MRERLRDWVLLHGSRYTVTGCVLTVMGGILLLPGLAGVTIRNVNPLYYVGSGLISGNITLVTVVVAINQLVLSRELEAPGELRDEIEETADFRRTATSRSPAPVEASDFLRRLARQTQGHARSLAEVGSESTNERIRSEIEGFVPELVDHCENVDERLDDGEGRLFDVIAPVIGAPYAEYVHAGKRIRASLPEGERERTTANVDRLTADLEALDVARQYFTTMVVKEELAVLSRSLVYVGVPAVTVSIAMLIQLAALEGGPVRPTNAYALTALTALVGLAPLALLSAYVLRIATIAQHLAAITPFEAG